jgi:hypothetical protein
MRTLTKLIIMTKSYTPDELHRFATELHEARKERPIRDPSSWWAFLLDIAFWIDIAKIVFKYFLKK